MSHSCTDPLVCFFNEKGSYDLDQSAIAPKPSNHSLVTDNQAIPIRRTLMSHNTKLVFAALTFIVFSLSAGSSSKADTVVYTNNFSSSMTAPGVTATLTGGRQQTAPNGEVFREYGSNDLSNVTLTISGLQANSMTTL